MSAALAPTEAAEQCAVFAWAALYAGRRPELALLFAIPNFAGVGKRTGASGGWIAARLAEGMRPGVPDLCLPVARGGFHGFFGEMKRYAARATKTKGVTRTPTAVKPAQAAWHERLRGQGYHVVVAWSAEEMRAAIEAYLRLPAAPNPPTG